MNKKLMSLFLVACLYGLPAFMFFDTNVRYGTGVFTNSVVTPVVIGSAGQAVNIHGGTGTSFALGVQDSTGASNLFVVANNGDINGLAWNADHLGNFNALNVGVSGLVHAGAVPSGASAGDLSSARSTTQGAIWLGSDAGLALFRSGATSFSIHTSTTDFGIPLVSDQAVGRATTDTLTNKTLSHPVITTGISQGSGVKHQRLAGCTTTAGVGGSCTTTLTWTSAFPDTSYTFSCSAVLSGGQAFPEFTKTATTIVVSLISVAAGAATATEFDCIAIHD